jgi:Ca2+-binding EF-hand superfamily protein
MEVDAWGVALGGSLSPRSPRSSASSGAGGSAVPLRRQASSYEDNAQALAEANDYDEYALVINNMSLEVAQAACLKEGIAPRDTTLLGLRAALLYHFCGPPPTNVDLRAARSARAAQMRGAGRKKKKPVPIWGWNEMRRLCQEAPVTAEEYEDRIEQMSWQGTHIACRRLAIPTEGISAAGTRAALLEHLLSDNELKLRSDDYGEIISSMKQSEAIAACQLEGITPLNWTPSSVKAALRQHLCTGDGSGRRGVVSLGTNTVVQAMKGVVGLTRSKGLSPFEKWASFKKAKQSRLDAEHAERLFKEIDTDGSNSLDRSEIRHLAEKLGGGLTDQELDEAMREMDADGDNEVSLEEFQDWFHSARNNGSTWDAMINRRERQDQERDWLQDMFKAIDEDDGGTLDLQELNQLTIDMGLSLNRLELEQAFTEMDDDGNGDIDFDEFFHWYQTAPKTGSGLAAELQRGLRRSEILQIARDAMFSAFEGKSERHLKLMFDRLDEDGSRAIEAEELTHLVNGLRLNLAKEEIEEAVQDISTTGDGEISFKDFSKWWNDNSGGSSGRLRSKLKLAGFLAKKHGSVLVATELVDDNAGLAATEQYMHDLLSSAFSRTQSIQGKSLNYFEVDHPVRQAAHQLLLHPLTERMLVLLILINMASMGFTSHDGIDPAAGSIAEVVNVIIGFVFVAEIALRIIQLGFCRGEYLADGTYSNTSYLTGLWNLFDFVVVTAWLLTELLIVTGLFNWSRRASNSIAVLRSLRCLRFFKHVRQMLTAIRRSTVIILDISYIFVLLFIVFGVGLHMLLGGALSYTCAVNITTCPQCHEDVGELCPQSLGCERQGLQCFSLVAAPLSSNSNNQRELHIDKFGFDSLLPTFLTLFSVTTLDDWHTYVYTFATASGHPWWFVWVPIACLVIMLGLCAVNVFLAGIAYAYMEVRNAMKTFEDEKSAKSTIAMMLLVNPDDVDSDDEEDIEWNDPMCFHGMDKVTYLCRDIMQHSLFENGILVVVVANIVLMASEHYDMSEAYKQFLLTTDVIFTVIYLCEALIKLQGCGPKMYFSSTMNRLDFIIVASALVSYGSMLIDTVIDVKMVFALRLLRVFRLLRVGRIAKLVLKSESVRYLLSQAFSSGAAILSLGFLITFLIAVSSLAGQQMFGACRPSRQELVSVGNVSSQVTIRPPRPNFSTFGDALSATFIVFSTDSWTGMMFDFMECSPYKALVFFILNIFVLYFLLSELFVAVFIENFGKEDEDKRAEQIQQYLDAGGGGGHDVLDIRMKLDTVNDFLKMRKQKKFAFETFVSGVALSKSTAKAIVRAIPGAAPSASYIHKACFRFFGTKRSPTFQTRAALDVSLRRSQNPMHDNPIEIEAGDTEFRDYSCGYFSPDSKFRNTCKRFGQSSFCQWATLCLLVINGLECARLQNHLACVGTVCNTAELQSHTAVRRWLCLGFVLELLSKLVAYGVIFTPEAYLLSLPHVFEVLMVLLQLYCVVSDETANITMFVSLASVRVLVVIERLNVIVSTVKQALPAVMPVLALIASTFLVFAILGMNLFSGKFWHCEPNIQLSRDQCTLQNQTWVNRNYHYDDVFSASESLFIVWTLQGWVPLMYWSMDVSAAFDSDGMAPVRDDSFWTSIIFYFVYTLWQHYMLTNLFVSILVDFFSANSGNLLMTEGQRDWQYVNLVLFRLQPIKPLPITKWRLRAYSLVTMQNFEVLVDAFVVLNVLQLIIVNSLTALPDFLWPVVIAGQSLALIVFIFECVLQLIAFGPGFYFEQYRVEFLTMVIMLISTSAKTMELLSHASTLVLPEGWRFLQVLQVIRVVRLAKVFGHIKGVKKLYYVIRVSFPEVFNLLICVFVLIFTCGSVATNLCGGAPWGEVFDEYDHFNNPGASMRMLFQIMTGQGFLEITEECESYSIHSSFVKPFFMIQYFVLNFIFLSLFIALLLDNLALMGSDNFAISDVDVQLFRETWLQEGMEPHERLNVAGLRKFVARMPGSFSFIHKSDPFWFNRLMLELDLTPQEVEAGHTTISMNRLLRALCQMRFSSRCLAL